VLESCESLNFNWTTFLKILIIVTFETSIQLLPTINAKYVWVPSLTVSFINLTIKIYRLALKTV